MDDLQRPNVATRSVRFSCDGFSLCDSGVYRLTCDFCFRTIGILARNPFIHELGFFEVALLRVDLSDFEGRGREFLTHRII